MLNCWRLPFRIEELWQVRCSFALVIYSFGLSVVGLGVEGCCGVGLKDFLARSGLKVVELEIWQPQLTRPLQPLFKKMASAARSHRAPQHPKCPCPAGCWEMDRISIPELQSVAQEP